MNGVVRPYLGSWTALGEVDKCDQPEVSQSPSGCSAHRIFLFELIPNWD